MPAKTKLPKNNFAVMSSHLGCVGGDDEGEGSEGVGGIISSVERDVQVVRKKKCTLCLYTSLAGSVDEPYVMYSTELYGKLLLVCKCSLRTCILYVCVYERERKSLSKPCRHFT